MHWLERHWYRITWLHLLLLPLSLAFVALSSLRRTLYRLRILPRHRLPVPVIVVGNITVGGTGKTPLVLWLAAFLAERGYRPGIVTRGYGGSGGTQQVTADSDPGRTGDEPVLLARRSGCPVWAGRNRAAAARTLLENHPQCDVVISDDGLQHYALARDIEIALVDAQRRFGNGLPLPAGPLREHTWRLATVDAVVVTGEASPAGGWLPAYVTPLHMQLEGEQFVNLLTPGFRASASHFHGANVHALAAIGNPQRFFAHLQRLGLAFTGHPFPDHHPFSAEDLAFAGDDPVLMTEKDGVKCAAFARENFWVLPVDAEVDPALGELVASRLRTWNDR